jgi:hypothetical protein
MEEPIEQDNIVITDTAAPAPDKSKAKKKKTETNPFNQEKFDKLVDGARKALAQYRIAHRELTYPGFKELSEGLGEDQG